MKKNYEKLEIEVFFMPDQDIVTASVFVKWGDDWSGNQDGNWTGHNFC